MLPRETRVEVITILEEHLLHRLLTKRTLSPRVEASFLASLYDFNWRWLSPSCLDGHGARCQYLSLCCSEIHIAGSSRPPGAYNNAEWLYETSASDPGGNSTGTQWTGHFGSSPKRPPSALRLYKACKHARMTKTKLSPTVTNRCADGWVGNNTRSQPKAIPVFSKAITNCNFEREEKKIDFHPAVAGSKQSYKQSHPQVRADPICHITEDTGIIGRQRMGACLTKAMQKRQEEILPGLIRPGSILPDALGSPTSDMRPCVFR